MSHLLARLNYLNGQIQAMVADVAVRPERLAPWRSHMATETMGVRDLIIQAEAGLRRAMQVPQPDLTPRYPQY